MKEKAKRYIRKIITLNDNREIGGNFILWSFIKLFANIGKLSQAAAALTYHTLFAAVPIIALMLATSTFMGYGDAFTRPDKAMGRQACENLSDSILMEGDYGAGCGATVGKLKGMEYCCNSGIGSWSEVTENGIKVAALIAVNAFGDVYEDGKIIAGTKNDDGTFLPTEDGVIQMASSLSFSGQNTTIGIIATNVKLTKAQAKKVAGMAHDGLARCIRPIHTTMDGDTLFCLSTEELELPTAPVDVVGILAAKATEQAVIRAVRMAK